MKINTLSDSSYSYGHKPLNPADGDVNFDGYVLSFFSKNSGWHTLKKYKKNTGRMNKIINIFKNN